jgi:hypothetical protein
VDIEEGKFYLELDIGSETIVEIEERHLHCKLAPRTLYCKRDIDLPAMPWRSLRIIGNERRPCPGKTPSQEQVEEYG